jgi:hypothetical protein
MKRILFLSNATPFKWCHFEAEIILLCVRWYLRYALSYRDLEEMMAERGLSVDHTTIYRFYGEEWNLSQIFQETVFFDNVLYACIIDCTGVKASANRKNTLNTRFDV